LEMPATAYGLSARVGPDATAKSNQEDENNAHQNPFPVASRGCGENMITGIPLTIEPQLV
jgi:hypothetical protein